MAKKVTQMIEDQISFWNRQFSPGKSKTLSGNKYPIITISREFGAPGEVLGSLLSEMLGFKVWDKDLLKVISERLGSSQEYIKSLDETRRGMLEDTIFGFMHQRETNLHYLLYLVKAVRALERYGNNIIVGRGANYICQSPTSLHLRLVSPLKTRIENYARDEKITKEKATALVTKKDEERARFIKLNFNRDLANAADYDLIMNTKSFTLEEMAELTLKAYELKTGIRPPLQTKKIHA